MKAILMSIKPKWCEKIFSGEKTVEVRKVAPKLEPPYVEEIAEDVGVKKSEAKKFYEYYASQGWKFSNGRAVEDIPSALMRWNSRANQFAGKNADGKHFENERTYTKEQLDAWLVNADNFDVM